MVVISKDGTIGEIYEIQNLKKNILFQKLLWKSNEIFKLLYGKIANKENNK